MPHYLCYDIKGIQQFIFSVPKLRYVVGASLVIDRFDVDARELKPGKVIFTGGGRGTFSCDSEEDAKKLRKKLVEKAHEVGLDLRIGINEDISEATCHADDLYAFVPDISQGGEPCRASGLWPVPLGKGCGFKEEGMGIHPMIWERREASDEKSADYPFEKTIFDNITLPKDIRTSQISRSGKVDLEFLKAVRADSRMRNKDYEIAEAADFSLGNRNRWAVLAMDGNDMGAQFRAFQQQNEKLQEEKKSTYAEKLEDWLSEMSEKLNECTRQAFYHGLSSAIADWWKGLDAESREKTVYGIDGPKPVRVLPFRPLIIGGDDILCICHASFALTMARSIIKEFNHLSKKAVEDVIADAEKKGKGKKDQEKKDKVVLWPGTGDELTISAGIAYTGVTMPLFNSIPYAESLLGSAKGAFRKKSKEPADKDKQAEPLKPTQAAIDWEHITETMIDTPAARRDRDLRFDDPDQDGIELNLTSCPYAAGESLEDLLDLKNVLSKKPRGFLAELMAVLRLPWAKRVQRLAAMRKAHPEIVNRILDFGIENPGNLWKVKKTDDGKTVYRTTLLDAILLLEEEHRMTQTTTG